MPFNASLSAFALFFLCFTSCIRVNSYPSSCGDLHSISYPFHLQDDGTSNDEFFGLTCNDNRPILRAYSRQFVVKEISYEFQTVRILDAGLQSENCSSLPERVDRDFTISYYPFWYPLQSISDLVIVTCALAVDDPMYVETSPCLNSSSISQPYMYALLGSTTAADLHDNCTIDHKYEVGIDDGLRTDNLTYLELHRLLLKGFLIAWKKPYVDSLRCLELLESPHCFVKKVLEQIEVMLKACLPTVGRILIGRTSVGFFLFSLLLIYKLQQRHFSNDDRVEEFLTIYKSHTPKRYSYWEIWMMTNRFKEKLGKGGFGSVFKGKLPDGHPVAVKMLSKSKGNGQDFINEVATIGRIHHVNVVKLIGFCAAGFKRALVYDYMPNGSLEKYLFLKEGKDHNSLSWEKMHEIALGIARGIDYLHRGCDMRILHFDIKPHNILLDANLIPKVSDFGLAKFYPTDESLVAVTAIRGTIGYIAPELFYHNAGGVSYKSDVYSFGMLLMEMAGRRKNVEAAAGTSQLYFPSWIYDRLEVEGDVGIEGITDDEKEIAKKLIIVALWCIQMRPVDRPSMSKVVEMLEGSIELLEMPRKPFLSSPERVQEDEYNMDIEMTLLSSSREAESPSQSLLSPR